MINNKLLAKSRSGLCWPLVDRVYSGSWDCTLRAYDVTTQQSLATLTGPQPLLALDYALATGLCASGDVDRQVRLWDPRAGGGAALVLKALASHGGWVTAVRWHPYSANLLLSASHDHTLKVWDIRATIPLFTIAAHTDKVLCVDWYGAEKFVSGGADRQLRVHGAQAGDTSMTATTTTTTTASTSIQ